MRSSNCRWFRTSPTYSEINCPLKRWVERHYRLGWRGAEAHDPPTQIVRINVLAGPQPKAFSGRFKHFYVGKLVLLKPTPRADNR